MGLIGAGGFATETLLPILGAMPDKFRLHAVADRTGLKALEASRKFGGKYGTTEADGILRDPEVDLVLLATRHESHASLALKALQFGKHVFVEKPLATTQGDLEKLAAFFEGEGKPVLMTGFNRRFSPCAKEMKRALAHRLSPLIMIYRMNAGYIPLDHWVHEHGGRMVGEACHIVDLMCHLSGALVKRVSVEAIPSSGPFGSGDNRTVTLSFEDGSMGTIHYFAMGHKQLPKEAMELHFDGKSIVMDDYRSLKGYGLMLDPIDAKLPQKGHREEWLRLYATLTGLDPVWPIALEEMVNVTQASFLMND